MRTLLSIVIVTDLLLLAMDPVASAAVPVDPATPESAVLLPVQVLRNDDFKGFFRSLPAEDQAKAEAQWTDARTHLSPQEAKRFNETMALLLAPDAVEQLLALAQPRLQEMNPQKMSQEVAMFSGLLPRWGDFQLLTLGVGMALGPFLMRP